MKTLITSLMLLAAVFVQAGDTLHYNEFDTADAGVAIDGHRLTNITAVALSNGVVITGATISGDGGGLTNVFSLSTTNASGTGTAVTSNDVRSISLPAARVGRATNDDLGRQISTTYPLASQTVTNLTSGTNAAVTLTVNADGSRSFKVDGITAYQFFAMMKVFGLATNTGATNIIMTNVTLAASGGNSIYDSSQMFYNLGSGTGLYAIALGVTNGIDFSHGVLVGGGVGTVGFASKTLYGDWSASAGLSVGDSLTTGEIHSDSNLVHSDGSGGWYVNQLVDAGSSDFNPQTIQHENGYGRETYKMLWDATGDTMKSYGSDDPNPSFYEDTWEAHVGFIIDQGNFDSLFESTHNYAPELTVERENYESPYNLYGDSEHGRASLWVGGPVGTNGYFGYKFERLNQWAQDALEKNSLFGSIFSGDGYGDLDLGSINYGEHTIPFEVGSRVRVRAVRTAYKNQFVLEESGTLSTNNIIPSGQVYSAGGFFVITNGMEPGITYSWKAGSGHDLAHDGGWGTDPGVLAPDNFVTDGITIRNHFPITLKGTPGTSVDATVQVVGMGLRMDHGNVVVFQGTNMNDVMHAGPALIGPRYRDASWLTNMTIAGISTNGSSAGQVIASVGGVPVWTNLPASDLPNTVVTNNNTGSTTQTIAGTNVVNGSVGATNNMLANKGQFTNGVAILGGTFSGDGSGVTNVPIGALSSTTVSNKFAYAVTLNTNLIIYTVPSGVTNTYEVGGWVNVTAVTVDVVNFQVLFTDENNTAQTIALDANITATGFNTVSTQGIRAKGGTTITIKGNLVTGTGSITYDIGGFVKPIL